MAHIYHSSQFLTVHNNTPAGRSAYQMRFRNVADTNAGAIGSLSVKTKEVYEEQHKLTSNLNQADLFSHKLVIN